MYNKEINRFNTINGYIYFYDPEHPLAISDGIVYYHRHLMSLKMGRWLKRDEVVHHIDGNRANNNLDNLVVLTASSHTAKHKTVHELLTIYCKYCNKEIKTRDRRRIHCSVECQGYDKRRFNPTKEELEKLVWQMPSEKVGELFGVSGNAIGKRCKLLGIKKPGRGYWMKRSSLT